jgi:RNA polymerase sigma-70 factor (ECF subfamily)
MDVKQGLGAALALHRVEVSVANPTEADMVIRAKSNPQAFAQLYEVNYSVILNYVYRRTLNAAVAQDLTSNTFFKALRALPRYNHRGPFRAWLYRIATNEVRTYYRDKQRHKTNEQNCSWEEELDRISFASPEAETLAVREEKMHQYARLRESLAALPEPYQTVLVLRYFEGLHYDEIAKVQGKRLGTVKSLINRGLKRLRNVMQKGDTALQSEGGG